MLLRHSVFVNKLDTLPVGGFSVAMCAALRGTGRDGDSEVRNGVAQSHELWGGPDKTYFVVFRMLHAIYRYLQRELQRCWLSRHDP